MTYLQKTMLRQSETREAINRLLGVEERTQEQDTELHELTETAQRLEVEYRAGLAAEGEERAEVHATIQDSEARERESLRSRSLFGRYLTAHWRGRALDGPEAEFAAACAVGDGVPLALFEERRNVESHADASTAAPGTVGVNMQPIQQMLFAPSIAPTLRIDMPQVGSGTFATSTITTALTTATKGKGEAIESTSASMTVSTSTVKRISGRLTVREEDVQMVGVGNFESSLRENLQLVMSDAFDTQALTGDGSGNNLTGILKRLTDPTDPTTVVDWDGFNGAFADQIDGLWSVDCTQVRMICGVDTYKKSVKTFRDRVIDSGQRGGVSLGSESAAAYLMKTTGGWRTNKRMPAASSNIQAAVAVRTGRSVRTAVLPLYNRLAISDPYTSSASAETHFTVHVLCGDVVLVQPSAYAEVRFKLA